MPANSPVIASDSAPPNALPVAICNAVNWFSRFRQMIPTLTATKTTIARATSSFTFRSSRYRGHRGKQEERGLHEVRGEAGAEQRGRLADVGRCSRRVTEVDQAVPHVELREPAEHR